MACLKLGCEEMSQKTTELKWSLCEKTVKRLYLGGLYKYFDKSVIYIFLICFPSLSLTRALYYTNKLKVMTGF